MNDPEAFPFVLLGNKVDVDGGNSRRVLNIPPPFAMIIIFSYIVSVKNFTISTNYKLL